MVKSEEIKGNQENIKCKVANCCMVAPYSNCSSANAKIGSSRLLK